jgi:putative FmdB family regulatory protein
VIYDYTCDTCDTLVEITKPMAESSRKEDCPVCRKQLRRLYTSKIQFIGTQVKNAEYYVPFDKVIKNDRQRRYEIEKRGLIEIGNEKPERARYYMERERKQRLAKDYED